MAISMSMATRSIHSNDDDDLDITGFPIPVMIDVQFCPLFSF